MYIRNINDINYHIMNLIKSITKDQIGDIRETYKTPYAGTKECVQRM